MSGDGNRLAAWIWLQEIVKGVRFHDKLGLLDRFAEPDVIFREHPSELSLYGITPDIHQSFFTSQALDQARAILDRHLKLGIRHVTRQDPLFRGGDWLVLYYKGSLSTEPAAAVVGTRQCSAHGYYYAQQVCSSLVSQGFIINSGLAKGIDHQAHCTALDQGGKTRAFLAHGLDICYPREHAGLLAAILEKGAAITPFSIGTRPYRHHFATRNALMCAWSDDVIVVEASEHSGALITAEFARLMGKRLWTVESSSMSQRCSGNRALLKLGAKPWRSSDGTPIPDPAPGDDELLRLLRPSPLSPDQLVRAIGKPLSVIEDHLVKCSLDHWIIFSGDGKWHYNGW